MDIFIASLDAICGLIWIKGSRIDPCALLLAARLSDMITDAKRTRYHG